MNTPNRPIVESMNTQDEHNNRIDPNASPDTIEQQIDQKRSSINRTISELEDKFSPQQLIDQGTTMFREHGGDIAQSLSRSFRNNPAPFIVAGVGLAWLMASTSSTSTSQPRSDYSKSNRDGYQPRYDDDGMWAGTDFERQGLASTSNRYYLDDDDLSSDDNSYADKAKNLANDMGSSMTEKRDELSERATNLGEDISDSAADLKARTEHRARQLHRRSEQEFYAMQQRTQNLQRQAGRYASTSMENSADFLRNQPMVTGAIGIAIGALVGSLIPETRLEREHLGAASKDARQQAASLAEDGMSRARQEVERLADKAGDAAEKKLSEADQKAPSSQSDKASA